MKWKLKNRSVIKSLREKDPIVANNFSAWPWQPLDRQLPYRNLESSQWWTVGRRLNERFATSRSLGPYHSKVNVFTPGSLDKNRLLRGKLIFHSCPPADHFTKVSKKYTRWGVDRVLTDFIALGTRVLTGGTNISSSCSRAVSILCVGCRLSGRFDCPA